jgi:hypothetical protein
MATTLADALRGYQPPTTSALADPIMEHFRNLPQTTAQNAINTNNMVQNAIAYDPNTGKFNEGPTFSEFANYVPNLMGSTNAIKTAKALLSAEKQAMLPTSEGGLGLTKGNTPAERAVEQGYIDYYHGTERLDRLLQDKTLNPKRATSGPMPFGTDNPNVASNYATGKQDTSRIMENDIGDLSRYFEVSPKDLGHTRSRNPMTVEQSWYHLPESKRAEIADKARKIGYENSEEGTGKFVVHPTSQNMPFSEAHYDYTLKNEAGGNPLKALRNLYAESGILDAYVPSELADIYKLAGYPHQISQANAPWSSTQGVLLGKARITNPIHTSNIEEIQSSIIPALKEAFKNDKTRPKTGGADQWDKNTRYTPKEWVNTLEKDLINGVGTPIPEQSYVWTSIPDKVTEQLKKLGYNGIIDTGGKMGGAGHQVVIPFDPSQVRSKFAAFNPADVNKPDLLAGALAVPMADEDTRKATLEKLFNKQK